LDVDWLEGAGMNQYRCETCKNHVEDNGFQCCKFIKGWVEPDEYYLITEIGCASHSDFQSEREDMLKQKYSQLMAASINNKTPGWVQIADIESILKPFDMIIPDIENLQRFPFRSYPKREPRPSKTGE
jgi:hypothetical protein